MVLGLFWSRLCWNPVLDPSDRGGGTSAHRSPLKSMISRSKMRISAVLVIAAAGLVALRIFNPASSGVFPPCPLHYLTGLYCPGCGSLRAIHALLHGNLHNAWAMNPLTMVLLPFLIHGLA